MKRGCQERREVWSETSVKMACFLDAQWRNTQLLTSHINLNLRLSQAHVCMIKMCSGVRDTTRRRCYVFTSRRVHDVRYVCTRDFEKICGFTIFHLSTGNLVGRCRATSSCCGLKPLEISSLSVLVFMFVLPPSL